MRFFSSLEPPSYQNSRVATIVTKRSLVSLVGNQLVPKAKAIDLDALDVGSRGIHGLCRLMLASSDSTRRRRPRTDPRTGDAREDLERQKEALQGELETIKASSKAGGGGVPFFALWKMLLFHVVSQKGCFAPFLFERQQKTCPCLALLACFCYVLFVGYRMDPIRVCLTVTVEAPGLARRQGRSRCRATRSM